MAADLPGGVMHRCSVPVRGVSSYLGSEAVYELRPAVAMNSIEGGTDCWRRDDS